MTFNFGFDITESERVIQLKIMLAFVKKINKAIIKAIPKIQDNIQAVVPLVLYNTEIYRRLIGQDLAGHFGFYKGKETKYVDAIINKIGQNAQINFISFRTLGQSIKGGLIIDIQRSDYQDLLNLREAYISYVRQFPNGSKRLQFLNWLEWLLLRGNEIIIADYSIEFQSGKGRSRQAHMVIREGGFWKVPGDVSGTFDDNWITRSLRKESSIDLLTDIIRSEVSKVIRIT